MAVTDTIERAIDRVFSEQVLPLAADLKRQGLVLLETRLDTNAASYFINRASRGMTKDDFENGGCTAPDAAEAELVAAWSRSNLAPLKALAPGIARLAANLRAVEKEAQGVSEFVYVMY